MNSNSVESAWCLQVMKWISIPLLLLAAGLSPMAGRYELLVNFGFCLAATIVFQRAVWLKEYLWCAGLVAMVVVFSPFLMVTKLFLLMIPTSAMVFLTIRAAFRRPIALQAL